MRPGLFLRLGSGGRGSFSCLFFNSRSLLRFGMKSLFHLCAGFGFLPGSEFGLCSVLRLSLGLGSGFGDVLSQSFQSPFSFAHRFSEIVRPLLRLGCRLLLLLRLLFNGGSFLSLTLGLQ